MRSKPKALLAPTVVTMIFTMIVGISVATAEPYSSQVNRDFRVFNEWVDIDGSGCTGRDKAMLRDLTNIEQEVNSCTVVSGVLPVDPYFFGSTPRGVNTKAERWSSEPAVSRVFNLREAWNLGAKDWTKKQQQEFSNDPLNLITSTIQGSAFKNAKSPADIYVLSKRGTFSSKDGCALDYSNRFGYRSGLGCEGIPEKFDLCRYQDSYAKVASKYKLPITPEDRAALRFMSLDCNG